MKEALLTSYWTNNNATVTNQANEIMGSQWANPRDILSILLLLGPDTVQKAVAQLSGRAVTPAAFSVGWVGYAITALVGVFGSKFALLHI